VTRDLGWLDTNIFVHALHRHDPFHRRCRAILNGLETGHVAGWIDPLVIHELTYVLKRIPSFTSRKDSYEYIHSVLACETIYARDKPLLVESLARWADSERLSFTDAWLLTLCQRRNMPVCSVNRNDFASVANSFPQIPID
jgi:predicted nucleic acid-binding protein